jgi:hypothetical protein
VVADHAITSPRDTHVFNCPSGCVWPATLAFNASSPTCGSRERRPIRARRSIRGRISRDLIAGAAMWLRRTAWIPGRMPWTVRRPHLRIGPSHPHGRSGVGAVGCEHSSSIGGCDGSPTRRSRARPIRVVSAEIQSPERPCGFRRLRLPAKRLGGSMDWAMRGLAPASPMRRMNGARQSAIEPCRALGELALQTPKSLRL